MITDFKIDENLKVEFLTPDADGTSFILGISQLGGTDLLGGFGEFILGVSLLGGEDVLGPSSGLKWQEVDCSTSRAMITVGGDVVDSIYFEPQPGMVDLELQALNIDPTVNKNIRAATKVRVRVTDEELDRILFQGNIDTISVEYFPNGLNLIRLTAFDAYKSLVNSRFPIWNTTPIGLSATVDEVFELIGIQSGLGISDKSISLDGKIPTVNEENKLASSVLLEALQVGQGIIWVDQDTQQLVVIPRPTNATGNSDTYTIGNNHGEPKHLCMSEINVFSSADAVYNSLTVSLSSDEGVFVTRKDQDSIDFYGESAIDISLNTTDIDELELWANKVFTQNPENLVNQVQTPAVDRFGTLTDAAVFTPGTTIGISYTKDQLNIVGFYTIIKVSHRIDVDNWFTTLTLWKEA